MNEELEIIKIWYRKESLETISQELNLSLSELVFILKSNKLDIYIIEGDGKIRSAKLINCTFCDIPFLRAHRNIKDNNFCSKKCVGKQKTKDNNIELKCDHCGRWFLMQKSDLKNSKSGKHFCCRKCKDSAQSYMKEIQPPHYGVIKSNYRKIAFNSYESKCNDCGFSNKLALEVHHIDKNRENNLLENLVILCANCHRIRHRGEPE